jgi:APA family basic amino acid/polyamine antiporter
VNLFFLKDFQRVVIYIQFNLLLCSLLTVLGVIVLRRTQPEIARPYRVWLYPLPPLIFAIITIWMMIYLLQSNPVESLSAVATLIAGFALYYFVEKRRQSA